MNPNEPLSSFDPFPDQSLQNPIPPADIEQFRKTFESAWNRRSRFQRLLANPAFIFVGFMAVIAAAVGSSNIFFHAWEKTQEMRFPKPGLMPGQRIANHPELLSFFPQVQHPTVISVKTAASTQNDKFMMHGYLYDGDIQLVWEY